MPRSIQAPDVSLISWTMLGWMPSVGSSSHPRLAGPGALLPADRIAYPVAVGVASAAHGIDPHSACAAYLHAFTANGVSSALRLGMNGQTDGQHVLRLCEDAVLGAARDACADRLEDVGCASLAIVLFALAHETQSTRLFRS